MKHTMGNSTHCIDCYYYREKEEGDHCLYDGWCLKGQYNGNKKVADIASTRWNNGTGCDFWEDAEDRITSFEALTSNVDPSRTGMEKLYYEKLLKEAKETR